MTIEWFKCSEIMPPDDKEYLIFNGDCFSVGSFSYVDEDGNCFFIGCGPMWNVTHWAHLPNPPKE